MARTGSKLIPDWRKVHRFATVWVAAFWGAMCFAAAAWLTLDGKIPAWAFWTGGVLVFASISVARVTKQPGLHDE